MLIPVIALATAAIIGGKNLSEADANRAYAKRMTLKNLNRMGEARKNVQDKEKSTQLSVERLANRKYGILKTSIPKFIDLYEKLMEVNFQESDGIRELSDRSQLYENWQTLRSFNGIVKQIEPTGMEFLAHMLSAGGKVLCSGSLLAVSVGLPIIEGSVIGAQAVMLNPVFLPATFAMAVTTSIVSDAKREVTSAKLQRKYVNIVEAKSESDIAVLSAIEERAVRLTDLLTKMNFLFIKSMKVVEPMIDKNGDNRSLYTRQEKAYIRNCLNLADAVKSILDTPLFEQDGKIAEVSKEVVMTSEKYLLQMEQLMAE